MSAYQDFRPSEEYADLNPTDHDPRTWRYAIAGERGCVNVWLFAGDQVRFTETFTGPAGHVRALHIATAWMQYARELEPPEWRPEGTRIRGPA